MNFEGKRLLVIVPHPDDETLAAGGFMARVKTEGGHVYVMVMATGLQPQYGSRSESVIRKAELENSMRIVGVDRYELVFEDIHHLKLDLIPRKDLVDIIEDTSAVSITKVRPDILVFPGSSFNQDHNAIFEACLTATRPYPEALKFTPPIILLFSHFDEQAWNTNTSWQNNNFWVDISGYLDVKARLLGCYPSQIKQHRGHWRTVENVLTVNKMCGLRAGVEAAEEFRCIRMLI
jgi:LmbE family N-acetylglucosaminyl deacetylase